MISSICGLAILILRDAPARLRFYICLMILVSWLIPWQLLQFQAVSNTFTLPLNILSEFNLVDLITASQDTQSVVPVAEKAPTSLLTFYQLWLGVFALGLILFFKDLVSYIKLHRRWIKHSRLDNATWQTAQIHQPNCDIRRIKTHAPGMTTGLIKPIIWLDSEQHEAEKIHTIVLHELTHIRQHDPYWLWAINLVQRLFWWNPLIWFTAGYARQQIELSCDEQCKKHLPKGSYQLQLIKLTLQVNKQQQSLQMPAVLQMSGTPAFNLQRINKLNKEHKMKKRYVLVMAALLSLTGWIGFSNATLNVEQSQISINESHVLTEVHQSLIEGNLTLAGTQLNDLIQIIDTFSTSEQAKIWETHAYVSFSQNQENLQVTNFVDNALALEDVLTTEKRLSLLNMGQKYALSQNRYDKQIAYATKWFEIADAAAEKKQILFFTAISHQKLQQYDASAVLLNELISIADSLGEKPNEHWLGVQLGNHLKTKNLAEMLNIQKRIAQLYPSEKNDELLDNMSLATRLD